MLWSNYCRQSCYCSIPVELDHANRIGTFCFSDGDAGVVLKDYGAEPFVVNINKATKQNNAYQTALWTGPHLQVTLMRSKSWRRYRFGNAS